MPNTTFVKFHQRPSIRLLTKAGPRKPTKGTKWKRHIEILTDTPVKNLLEKDAQARTAKHSAAAKRLTMDALPMVNIGVKHKAGSTKTKRLKMNTTEATTNTKK